MQRTKSRVLPQTQNRPLSCHLQPGRRGPILPFVAAIAIVNRGTRKIEWLGAVPRVPARTEELRAFEKAFGVFIKSV